jgi:hypothetical protein
MNWKLLVCFAVLYQYGFKPTITKKIGAVEGSRTRKLVWQYFCAALLALTVAAITGQLKFNWSVIVVMIIGAANAFGCYCHWRAFDISMARTAILSNLDDLFAMGLGYAVLGELKVLTPILTAGIVVSIVSASIFAKIKYQSKTKPSRLIGWVLGFSIIWGVAMFSMRFFSVRELLSMPTFIAAWYVGAWFGSLFTRFVIMGHDEAGPPLTHIQRAKVFLLATTIWTSLMIDYWIRQMVPITVIQPIQLVAEMSIPVIIALIFFGEARNMSRQEIIVIIGGVIGVALIAIGF